jgi:hypothetical protein
MTYYIATNGNDANNGSIGSPWLTLFHATETVLTAGDIIHVNTGTYIETNQMYLAVGVSIEGNGSSLSIIHSHVTGNGQFLLMLHSDPATENVDGSQHISGVTFDGGSISAFGGISIRNRGNIIVSNCVIQDFLETGIQFNNSDGADVTNTYATGNEFYYNTLTNCSQATGAGSSTYGRGGIRIGGQEGFLLHDNTLTQLGRAAGQNGYVIKYGNEGL